MLFRGQKGLEEHRLFVEGRAAWAVLRMILVSCGKQVKYSGLLFRSLEIRGDDL
jgi:hypothetical protein